MGSWSPGLAHRMLGDGRGAPRGNHRYPRRRHRPAVPAPRERSRAERMRARRQALRAVLAAQRHAGVRRIEDVEVARQRRAHPHLARTLSRSLRGAALCAAFRALPAAARLDAVARRTIDPHARPLVRHVARPGRCRSDAGDSAVGRRHARRRPQHAAGAGRTRTPRRRSPQGRRRRCASRGQVRVARGGPRARVVATRAGRTGRRCAISRFSSSRIPTGRPTSASTSATRAGRRCCFATRCRP